MIRDDTLKIASFSDHWRIKTFAPSVGVGVDAESALARVGQMKKLLTGAAKQISGAHNVQVKSASIDGKLSEKNAALKRISASVAMYLDPDWRSRLFAKLDGLLDPAEWDEDFALPSEQSFSTFLRMIIYLHPTKRPGLGLSSKGHFLASWTNEQDRIVVECLADDEVRWVLSHHMKGHLESGAGKTKIYRLSDVIEPYEPEELFADGHSLVV